MTLSQILGWMIGVIDLVCMAYAIVDSLPFILMVEISLVYIATTVLKRGRRPKWTTLRTCGTCKYANTRWNR